MKQNEKKQVLIRMEYELYEKLKERAEREERDTMRHIIYILKKYIEEDEK